LGTILQLSPNCTVELLTLTPHYQHLCKRCGAPYRIKYKIYQKRYLKRKSVYYDYCTKCARELGNQRYHQRRKRSVP